MLLFPQYQGQRLNNTYQCFFLDYGYAEVVDVLLTNFDNQEGNYVAPKSSGDIVPPSNDIALLKLYRPIRTITPLSYGLPAQDNLVGNFVGFARKGTNKGPTGLKMDGKVEYSKCNKDYEKILCWVIGPKGVVSGEGDSGGVVISKEGSNNVVTGMLVYGSAGKNSPSPGDEIWLSSVGEYSGWIQRSVPEKEQTRTSSNAKVIDQNESIVVSRFLAGIDSKEFDAITVAAIIGREGCSEIELDLSPTGKDEIIECSSAPYSTADSCEFESEELIVMTIKSEKSLWS